MNKGREVESTTTAIMQRQKLAGNVCRITVRVNIVEYCQIKDTSESRRCDLVNLAASCDSVRQSRCAVSTEFNDLILRQL